jgi:hypothetical protein
LGFANCDANAANGCETNTLTDVQNCGGCGVVCPARANATTTCAGGVCGFTCNTGFANCDANAVNGCETNTTNNVQNCGACGNVCPTPAGGTATCTNGVCGATCSNNRTFCATGTAGAGRCCANCNNANTCVSSVSTAQITSAQDTNSASASPSASADAAEDQYRAR